MSVKGYHIGDEQEKMSSDLNKFHYIAQSLFVLLRLTAFNLSMKIKVL